MKRSANTEKASHVSRTRRGRWRLSQAKEALHQAAAKAKARAPEAQQQAVQVQAMLSLKVTSHSHLNSEVMYVSVRSELLEAALTPSSLKGTSPLGKQPRGGIQVDKFLQPAKGPCLYTLQPDETKTREINGVLRAPAHPGPDDFDLLFETINSSSWTSAKPWLVKSPAHIILVQEHHLASEASIEEASAWSRRHGWLARITPALVTPEGGTSGGTAILVRDWLGCCDVTKGPDLIPGRATACWVQVPGSVTILCVSLYLKDSEGLSEYNLGALAKVGALCNSSSSPFLVGGDFNMPPTELAECDFAAGLSATIVYPTDAITCTSTADGGGSLLDYFVCSPGLGKGIAGTSVVLTADTRPHRPVRVTFHQSLADLQVLTFVRPPTIPAPLPIGPFPQVASWSETLDCAEHALSLVSSGAPRSSIQRHVSLLYKFWANQSEKELEGAYQTELPRHGTRGKVPKLAWRNVLDQDRCRKPRQPALYALRWLEGNMRLMIVCASTDRWSQATNIAKLLFSPPKDFSDHLHLFRDLAQRVKDHVQPCVEDLSFTGQDELWRGEGTAILDSLCETLGTYSATARAEAAANWKEWLCDGIEGGGKRAHSWTRPPTAWTPTHTVSSKGKALADPKSLLQTECARFSGLWKAQEDPPPGHQGFVKYLDPLPWIEPDRIRQASRSYKAASAVGVDGFHMRHFNALSDPSLQVLMTLWSVMESTGIIPKQIRVLCVALLEKPTGGWRPIGIFAGYYRIWGRLRRPILQAWESTVQRPYLAASAFAGAADVVWRQALRSESAVCNSQVSCSLLWDLAKFFETICLDKLAARCKHLGFPEQIAAVCLNMYRGPRFLTLGRMVQGPFYAMCGVIAGCSAATSFVRAFIIPSLDLLSPRVQKGLDVYIDDYGHSVQARPCSIVSLVIEAATELHHVITEDMECTISLDKAALVCSSSSHGIRIKKLLGPLAGTPKDSAANLGMDETAGLGRRGGKRGNKFATRRRVFKQRLARFKRCRAMLGRHTCRIFTAGPLTGLTYDAETHGISDYELANTRRSLASTLKPSAGQRSLTSLLILYNDPTWRAAVAPIMRFSKEVWGSQVRLTDRALSFGVLGRAWKTVLCDTPAPTWRQVRGPLQAMRLSLVRIGWHMPAWHTLVNDFGDQIQLTTCSPALVADFLFEGVIRMHQRAVGDKLGMGRMCFDVVASELRRSAYAPIERGTVRLLACDGTWTKGRAIERGYVMDDDLCPLCQAAPDSLMHRLWQCQCVQEQRLAACDTAIIDDALRVIASGSDREKVLFSRGIFLHPGDWVPRPCQEGKIVHSIAGDPGSRPGPTGVSGHVFWDGSAYKHVVKELSRSGWGFVSVDPQGEVIASVSGAVGRPFPQTSQAGEYSGYSAAAQCLDGPTVGYADCDGVVRTHSAPKAVRFSHRKKYAGSAVFAASTHLGEVRKVKAHTVDSPDLSPEDRFLMLGNDAADRAAKHGASLHPQATPEETAQVDRLVSTARAVCRVAAAVLPSWPKLDLSEATRAIPTPPPPSSELPFHHEWEWYRGVWRCMCCLHFRRSLERPPSVGCRGEPPPAVQEMSNLGHRLLSLQCSDNSPLFVCLRCKAYTCLGRIYRLGRPCDPKQSGHNDFDRWRLMSRGFHPKLKGVSVEAMPDTEE